MGIVESELFQKKSNRKFSEPKISVDHWTFSKPNRFENFYRDGSEEFKIFESLQIVLNQRTETKTDNLMKLELYI